MSTRIEHVRLMTYRGERKFDEKGTYIGEKEEITLKYGDTEWAKHVGRFTALGVSSVDVLGAYGKGVWKGEGLEKHMEYPEIEISAELKAEVQSLFNPKPVANLTPEQKEIAELKARLDALTAAKPESDDNEIEELRKQYSDKFKKIVPNNKKNDANWLKDELSKNDAE